MVTTLANLHTTTTSSCDTLFQRSTSLVPLLSSDRCPTRPLRSVSGSILFANTKGVVFAMYHCLSLNSATTGQRTRGRCLSPPPSLNKRRGPNTVQPPSQVPRGSSYFANFVRFALSHLFSPRLTRFPSFRLFRAGYFGRVKRRAVNRDAPFTCFIAPSQPDFPLQGIPSADLYRRQSFTPLMKSSLPAHGSSQSRPFPTSPRIPSVHCHR